MTRLTVIAVAGAMVFGSSPLRSQQILDGPPITIGQRIDFPSRHLEQTRQLYIKLPSSYLEQGDAATRYPVLYLLDGADYFEPFAGIVEYMTMYEMIPELIVVGVSQGDRMSDLTFSPSNEENGVWPTSGGAEPLLRRLEEARLIKSKWEHVAIARSSSRPPRKYYELTSCAVSVVEQARNRFPSVVLAPLTERASAR